MKNVNTVMLLAAALLLFSNLAQGQTTKTVGTNGANYTTLKAAFDAINAGTLTGAVTLQVVDNTLETASIVLNASGTVNANYSSLTIYPTVTGKSISSTLGMNGNLTYLNGADNVTFDGRLHSSGGVLQNGDAVDLTFSNVHTGTNASTIAFANSAENNTVKYCLVKGSGASPGTSVIFFQGSTSGNGNSGNIITGCNITNAGDNRPANGFLSQGSSAITNKNNTIQNCNFYDLFSPAMYSTHIKIGQNSTGFTISGNSCYETSTIVPAGANSYYAISTSSGSEHMISGNYIGGSAPLCAGSAMTIGSSFPHLFAGIYTNGGTVTPVTIQNNIIQNINYTSTQSNPWDGIYLANGSGMTTITGNLIGAATGTGSVVVTTPNASATATISGGAVTAVNLIGGGSGFTTAPSITFSGGGGTAAAATATMSGGIVTGYIITNGGTGYTSAPVVSFNAASYSTSHGIRHLTTGAVTISNNTIGSVITTGSTTYSHCFEAIVISGLAGTVSITNNLIGSLSTANSIQANSTAATSATKQDVRGIYINSAVGVSTINGNTIANMSDAYTGTSVSKLDGICTSGGSNIVQNNTIRDLSTASVSIIVKGIQQSITSGTPQTATGNTVYNLSNTNTSATAVRVMGIDFLCPYTGTNTVSGNFIHSLSVASTNINSEINGITLGTGVLTCANNIISIVTSAGPGYKIYGIYDNSSVNASNNIVVTFNSVYIGGSVSSGTTNSTAALWNSNNTSIRNYRNNILVNIRSGGTTGKHYAVRISGPSGLTIDYNDYNVSGSGVLGNISGADKATIALWRTATGQDAGSLNIDPGYAVAGGTAAADYSTSATLPGVAGTGILTDYNGSTRGTPPRMGAIEFATSATYVWTGATSSAFNLPANWEGGAVPPVGEDISFRTSTPPLTHCSLDQNRTLGTITNASAVDLVADGFQLTITGTTNFSSTGKIDATATNSGIIYAGSAAQSFASGLFKSNVLYNLTLNNSAGLTQHGDITVSNALTLTSGTYAIGANTLTLNGAIGYGTGGLTGGETSNLIMGNVGANSTVLRTITLNNFTLNRTAGISMLTANGNLTVGGAMTFTAGGLTLNTNTLTYSGNSITRGSGYLSVSAGNLIFNNTSALTFPASLFGTEVNNMTVAGIGGITSAGDFTINGILHLDNGSSSSPNVSATLGLLDMGSNTLTMGLSATNTGYGDVTGKIRRDNMLADNTYSFGHPATTITYIGSGTMPAYFTMNIITGSGWSLESPAPVPAPIKRTYEMFTPTVHTDLRVVANFHYLDSELNGNVETDLVTGDYDIPFSAGCGGSTTHDEHGISQNDITTPGMKYIGLANMPGSYIMFEASASPTPPAHCWRTIFSIYTHNNTDIRTWDGSTSSNWYLGENWEENVVPNANSRVTIPDASTLSNLPVLPAGVTQLQSLSLGQGITLTPLADLTITATGVSGGGAWHDVSGGFIPSGHKVTFTGMGATISGITNFYDVEVGNGASVINMTDNVMRIGNSLTKTGSGQWIPALYNAVIEYNKAGDQSVVVPNGTPGFHTLKLSGSGIKTTTGAIELHGNLILEGTASATAAGALTLGGSLIIGPGTTFNTGNYDHVIKGNLSNDGTLSAADNHTLTFNGTSVQSMDGGSASSAYNVVIDNAEGFNMNTNCTLRGSLTLASGTLNVSGVTLTLASGSGLSMGSGNISVIPTTNLIFANGGSMTLPSNLFAGTPSLGSLTLSGTSITLGQSMTLNNTATLDGTLTVGANTLTLAGSSPIRTSGGINAGNAMAGLVFSNSSPITLPASLFTGAVNNIAVTGSGGLTVSGDFTINGILDLTAVYQTEGQFNPTSTKGLLDMGTYTLTMESPATTTGTGDVTGIVKRTAFEAGIPYTFGNQFTTVTFANTGTFPSEIKCKTAIGASPSWKSDAIQRIYDFVRTGGADCHTTVATHYLDSELNNNTESSLVQWTAGSPNTEWGKSGNNTSENWVSISNVDISLFPTGFGTMENTLANSSGSGLKTWAGALSTAWNTPGNWNPAAVPTLSDNVIIPDASSTPYSPTFSSSDNPTINTLTIQTNGVLNAGTGSTLTVEGSSGAWANNGGTFNPGDGTVIFAGADATIAGFTRFYNLTINTGKDLTPSSGSYLSVENTFTNSGTFHTALNPNTVEYNGVAQTVLNPNGTIAGYYNLTLSGSGIKTLPESTLTLQGSLQFSGTATATATHDLTIHGNLFIGSGTSFTTGSRTHYICGNFMNSGTCTTTGSTITLCGSSAQTIGGSASTAFNNITLNNPNGAVLAIEQTVLGVLTFSSGKITLGDNDLLLGTSASISGSNNSKFVITDGAGGLSQRVVNNATDVTYPIGLASGFSPVTVQLTAGSTADDIKVRVADGISTSYDTDDIPTGTPVTSRVVLKTWSLKESIAGGSNAQVTVQWNTADETADFTRNLCDVAQYTGGSWNYTAASAASGASPYTQARSGITTFGLLGVFGQDFTCSFNGTTFCAGSAVSVSYNASGSRWNSGNIFTAQLSDASGSFASPVSIGAAASQVSGTISAAIPSNTADGSAYRIRVVSDDPPQNGENNGTDITIEQLRSISGSFNYYNLANTPLTNDITVELYQDDVKVGSSFHVTNGTYEFTGLCPGAYEVRATSSSSTAGSVNTTDAGQINYWGTNPYTIQKVKFYAGDVTGSVFYLNSTDAQRVQQHFVNETAFDRPDWTFWKTGETISTNSTPGESYPTVTIPVGSNSTVNFLGLCTGDFNRSFTPGLKSARATLQLNDGKNRLAGNDQEFNLPIRTVNAMNCGAISLILYFPDDLVEVMDVNVNSADGQVGWTVNGNELRIGWTALRSMALSSDADLVTLTMKTTAAFTKGKSIRLTLSDDPLNELADERYEVMDDAKLVVDVVEASSAGSNELAKIKMLTVTGYPNPFNTKTTIGYTLPSDGNVILEIYNPLGQVVKTLVSEFQTAGYHTVHLETGNLNPGVYMSIIRLITNSDEMKGSLKLIRNN